MISEIDANFESVYFICAFAAVGMILLLILSEPLRYGLQLGIFLISIGGGLFGFDISSMSGVLGTMAYKRYFGNPVSYRQGGITCAMPFGSLVGALASSFIADKYSRRTSIQIASVFWVIGSM